jgi:hypothetical protein
LKPFFGIAFSSSLSARSLGVFRARSGVDNFAVGLDAQDFTVGQRDRLQRRVDLLELIP